MRHVTFFLCFYSFSMFSFVAYGKPRINESKCSLSSFNGDFYYWLPGGSIYTNSGHANFYIEDDFAEEFKSCVNVFALGDISDKVFSINEQDASFLVNSAAEVWNQQSLGKVLVYKGRFSTKGVSDDQESGVFCRGLDPSELNVLVSRKSGCRASFFGSCREATASAIERFCYVGGALRAFVEVVVWGDSNDKNDCNISNGKGTTFNVVSDVTRDGLSSANEGAGFLFVGTLKDILVHEFGHVLGLGHSHPLENLPAQHKYHSVMSYCNRADVVGLNGSDWSSGGCDAGSNSDGFPVAQDPSWLRHHLGFWEKECLKHSRVNKARRKLIYMTNVFGQSLDFSQYDNQSGLPWMYEPLYPWSGNTDKGTMTQNALPVTGESNGLQMSYLYKHSKGNDFFVLDEVVHEEHHFGINLNVVGGPRYQSFVHRDEAVHDFPDELSVAPSFLYASGYSYASHMMSYLYEGGEVDYQYPPLVKVMASASAHQFTSDPMISSLFDDRDLPASLPVVHQYDSSPNANYNVRSHLPVTSAYDPLSDYTVVGVVDTSLGRGIIYLHLVTGSVPFKLSPGVSVPVPTLQPDRAIFPYTGMTEYPIGVDCFGQVAFTGQKNCVVAWVDTGDPSGRILYKYFSVLGDRIIFDSKEFALPKSVGTSVAGVSAAVIGESLWFAWREAGLFENEIPIGIAGRGLTFSSTVGCESGTNIYCASGYDDFNYVTYVGLGREIVGLPTFMKARNEWSPVGVDVNQAKSALVWTELVP